MTRRCLTCEEGWAGVAGAAVCLSCRETAGPKLMAEIDGLTVEAKAGPGIDWHVRHRVAWEKLHEATKP